MVDDVGLGVHDGSQGLAAAAKIGDEHFDGGAGFAAVPDSRMVAAKWADPPSGRSSRVTDVTTAWRRPRAAAALPRGRALRDRARG